ncbi:MAG: hypothetical protein PHU71_07160 [Candidatus Gracilibacteria bacterium]|nr:hypothetical protein [Candidatus Gracilibacteria bacterium]
MSHFTVLVVTKGQNTVENEVEDALYNFWELDLDHDNLIKDPRAVPDVKIKDGDLEKSFVDWKEENSEYQKKHKYQSADEWLKDWDGYYKVPGGYGCYDNPNAKWDWYSIGGRWDGLLITKNGDNVDSAKKGDIDFDAMMERSRKSSADSWNELQDHVKKYPSSERTEYWLHGAKEDDTEESFIERKSKFCTYAMIKDGKWYANGDMGWFGFSSNEKDNWQDIFDKILDSIRDDEVVTVVDCHI